MTPKDKKAFIERMIDRHLSELMGTVAAEDLKKHIRIKEEVYRDNFTMIKLRDVKLKRNFYGFAKRRPGDNPDYGIGFRIAVSRAILEWL